MRHTRRSVFRAQLLLIALILVTRSSGVPAHAETPDRADYTPWPQYHFNSTHAGYNRHEKAINPSNVSSLEKSWQTFLPCTSYSSPVVAYGKVYFGNYCDALYALDEKTGVLKWVANTTGKIRATPAVADGRVYAASDDAGVLHAFNAETGLLIWTYTTEGDMAYSPTVKNGVVYVGSLDHNVYALNAADGTLKWKATLGGEVQSSPAIRESVLYVGSSDGNLYALDEATGAVLWQGTASGSVYSPAWAWTEGAGAAFVFVGTNTGQLYAFRATGCGQAICAPEWAASLGNRTSSSISVAVAYQRVFVGASDGSLYAFDARGCGAETCSPLWVASTGGSISGGPGVANGVVFTGSSFANAIFGFDAKTGALLWTYSGGSTPYPGDTSPAITNGTVFAMLTWEFSMDAFRLPD